MTHRFRPLTALGLRRKRCVRCGGQAEEQWRLGVCAINRRAEWYPLCGRCDAALNSFIVRFLNIEDGEDLIRRYRETQGVGPESLVDKARMGRYLTQGRVAPPAGETHGGPTGPEDGPPA